MANFVRGTTISSTTTVTAQTLADLIEDCTLANITGADIGGAIFTAVSTSTPNASEFPFWYNPNPIDPIFRVFAAPWNIWLAIGPDRFEIPLLNNSGTNCLLGTQVVVSGASDFTIGSQCSLNAIGFLQSTTPAGAWGPVATCGIGWALYCSSTSIGTPQGGVPSGGYAIINRGSPAGTVAGYDISLLEGSGPLFGMWVEGNRSGASGSMLAKRAYIWGPRLTQGF